MDLIENFALKYGQKVFEWLYDLCVIPAPSGQEDARALYCKKILNDNGITNAYIDDAKNLVVTVGDLQKPAVAVLAHTDTVFDKTTTLSVEQKDGKLFCPAIGDNTVSVAILLACAIFVKTCGTNFDNSFILAFNSCEEGMGNLKGAKKIYADYGDKIKEVLVFDGYLETLNDIPVGSKRYKVSVKTNGGHSFRDFGSKNAIEVVAQIITELSKVVLPKGGITTYNFGKISGGTTVNSIASDAEFLYEYRFDQVKNKEYMDGFFENVLSNFSGYATYTVIGERPCANGVDEHLQNELKTRVYTVLAKNGSVKTYPASTDCNVFASNGIPSICLGVSAGGGAHTLGEYIVKDSVYTGLKVALEILHGYSK